MKNTKEYSGSALIVVGLGKRTAVIIRQTQEKTKSKQVLAIKIKIIVDWMRLSRRLLPCESGQMNIAHMSCRKQTERLGLGVLNG